MRLWHFVFLSLLAGIFWASLAICILYEVVPRKSENHDSEESKSLFENFEELGKLSSYKNLTSHLRGMDMKKVEKILVDMEQPKVNFFNFKESGESPAQESPANPRGNEKNTVAEKRGKEKLFSKIESLYDSNRQRRHTKETNPEVDVETRPREEPHFREGEVKGVPEEEFRNFRTSRKSLFNKLKSLKFDESIPKATKVNPEPTSISLASIDQDLLKKASALPLPSERLHVFYYAWYKNKKVDGFYAHWNHPRLPHWNPSIDRQFDHSAHEPERGDIGSSFFPKLGPYSSQDISVISDHFYQIRKAGSKVVVLSWYPPHKSDPNGTSDAEERILQTLLDLAVPFSLCLAIHIEPYEGRTPSSTVQDVRLFLDKFGDHPGLFRTRSPSSGKLLPLFYVYDSYHNPPEMWKAALKSEKDSALYLFLWVESSHSSYAERGGFDGFYTYFASVGFVWGSSPQHWRHMKEVADRLNLLFVPSVGPGYIDTAVRPWNGENTKNREEGAYYDSMMESAVQLCPPFLSVTSFNEWHEGTQIEEIEKGRTGYMTYPTPSFYLEKTASWRNSLEEKCFPE